MKSAICATKNDARFRKHFHFGVGFDESVGLNSHPDLLRVHRK